LRSLSIYRRVSTFRSPAVFTLLIVLFSLSFITGCTIETSTTEGRMLLWHSWDETERPYLDQALSRFHDVYPDVEVISAYIPRGELLSRYRSAAAIGLGPDLFFASSQSIRELAQDSLIRDVTELVSYQDVFLSSALINTTYQGRLYGIPFGLEPVAMYYNLDLVESPAATLDDLLADVSDGVGVAINSQFEQAIWGNQAFGGRLFDEQGRVLLDEGGFANWLNWLKNAQENGIFLSRDDATLRDLFLQERVAYYVAGPDFIDEAHEALGAENVGITPLPSGPNGPSGPLLMVEALLVNESSAQRQVNIAITLAQFLTNNEQSAAFVRQSSLIPANRQVRIDERAYPDVAAFISQARTSVPIPNIPQMTDVLSTGNSILTRVFEGVLDVNDAAEQLTNEINTAYGFDTAAVVETTCQDEGRLVMWHQWQGRAARWLSDSVTAYEEVCPQVSVELVNPLQADDEAENSLLIAYQNAVETGDAPDILLGDSRWLLTLTNERLIQETPSDLLPRFLPAAQAVAHAGDATYGIPLTVDTPILFYDQSVIEDPAATLDDLLEAAQQGQSVGLLTDFDLAYFGIGAFGETMFQNSSDAEGITSTEAFVAWLAWLKEADLTPNVLLNPDRTRLRDLFITGNLSYYVGWSSEFDLLQSEMGANRVGLFTLPAGPAGAAKPFISAELLFVSRAITERQRDAALSFMTFLTDEPQQMEMAGRLEIIPSNTNVDVGDDTILRTLISQVATAETLPNTALAQRVRAAGSEVYQQVIFEDASPELAVEQFISRVESGVQRRTATQEAVAVTAEPEVE
jgi:maltose-binding protein MalE